jgi:virulence-associated protein VagC
MKARVTKRGLTIPREMLAGAEEVEIRKEGHRIVISPVAKSDPIFNLGKSPVECGVSDASEHHDKYLYGSQS